MIFAQHAAKLWRDPLRQKNRDPRADPQKFDVRDRSKPAQQMLELFIAEQQGISAAQQYVTDFRRVTDIFDLLIKLRMKIVAARTAHQPRARAVPAIRRA